MDRDTRDMLLETATRFFAERSAKDVVNGVEKGVWPADLWKEIDRKSTRLNSSHEWISRMPSSA